MKFHHVHGCNITIDDGGSRATRCNSFCDGIIFSHKPLPINCRLSLLLGSNDEWTGALRLGITTQDPSALANTKLPRYACPDLTSESGFWARPLPEKWACTGTRLTFYVNSCGQLHLFVNSEHKGAILTGLPVKEQLWVLLDLYGITVSAKFIATTGSAPIEVVARGPEAVLAFRNAINDGSTPYHCSRLTLIGPPNAGKSALKKILVRNFENVDQQNCGIDATWVCQTSSVCEGEPWILVNPVKTASCIETDGTYIPDVTAESPAKTGENIEANKICDNSEEAYFQAIAFNVAHELLQQKKKKNDERRKTPLSRSAFKLHSSLAKISPAPKSLSKQDENIDNTSVISKNLDIPYDLPERVVQLVETMLKESENKFLWEKKDSAKDFDEKSMIRFNIWDYSGCPKYFLLHQMFLCPQTIYLLVFDLSKELDSCISNSENNGNLEFLDISQLSVMACIHMWLELIYISVSYSNNGDQNQKQSDENFFHNEFHTLFPTVIIVGTRKEALSDITQIDHQFNKLKESIQNKIYFKHILPKFFAVSFENSEDELVQELRKKIEELTIQLCHVGMEIPLKWLLFEQAIDRLLERDVFFADINKLSEVARLESIESEDEFISMVHFFHHKGKIWHLSSDLLGCNGIVVLKPQWFINYIYQLLNIDSTKQLKITDDSVMKNHTSLVDTDIINTTFFEKLWPTAYHQINVLLSILDIADIICEIPKSKAEDCSKRSYFVPWLSKSKPYVATVCSVDDQLDFILEFSSHLPACFLLRFFIRLYRWSSPFAFQRNSGETCSQKVIAIDYNHDIALSRVSPNRIKVSLMHRKIIDSEEQPVIQIPTPHTCSKVRHLLEKEAEYLHDRWYKRLCFSLCIPCPCDKTCDAHSKPACSDIKCLHLLNLDECLSKKVVECDFRMVKTDFIQKFFSSTSLEECSSYNASARLSEDFTFAIPSSVKSFWEDHDVLREEPTWIRVAGKMLTLSNTGRDWIALSKRLGYSEKEVTKFQSDIYPPVSLLTNWLESNGQTRYCIDLLVSCLEQMGRQDIVDKIHIELGPEPPSSPVFISYQSDAQKLVLHLRRRLELSGYPCWMDVGNIKGGDSLYGRIYEGISKSKVVLCCLTPRYALSPICSREVSLADVLRKPIIPVMLEPTPWPPPGPMALILSSLVYIDLCDIGGHGGCGRQADWENRYQSITERISHFISPTFLTLNMTGTPGGRMAPPPPFTVKPENFVNAGGQSENDSPIDADTADEGDTSSVASSTRDQASSTPTTWEHPRPNNTVVRCSICILL